MLIINWYRVDNITNKKEASSRTALVKEPIDAAEPSTAFVEHNDATTNGEHTRLKHSAKSHSLDNDGDKTRPPPLLIRVLGGHPSREARLPHPLRTPAPQRSQETLRDAANSYSGSRRQAESLKVDYPKSGRRSLVWGHYQEQPISRHLRQGKGQERTAFGSFETPTEPSATNCNPWFHLPSFKSDRFHSQLISSQPS